MTLTRPPTHKKSTNESNCHLHGSVTSNITLADSRHSWRQKYFTNAANNDSLLLLIITGSNTSLYFHWHVWQAYLTEWHICSDNFGDSPSGNIPLLHLFVGTLNTPEDTNTHQFIIIFYLYMWCWIMLEIIKFMFSLFWFHSDGSHETKLFPHVTRTSIYISRFTTLITRSYEHGRSC